MPRLNLTAQQNVQAFNMQTRQRLGAFKLPNGQAVSFWRFVADDTIAIVTGTSVLHWKVNENQPRKMFDRHDSLRGTQIISYQVSGDKKWLLVVGIKKGASGIEGKMQLYSVEKSVSQPLNGHAGVFAEVKLPGRSTNSQVFCFAEKKAESTPKVSCFTHLRHYQHSLSLR